MDFRQGVLCGGVWHEDIVVGLFGLVGCCTDGVYSGMSQGCLDARFNTLGSLLCFSSCFGAAFTEWQIQYLPEEGGCCFCVM